MAVELVSEVEHNDRLRLVAPVDAPTPEQRPEPAEFPAPRPARPIFPAREVMEVIEALLKVLGLRVLLAAAFGAMAYLGYITVSEPTWTKIWAMAFWAVLGFLPVVVLVRQKG
jgi:hypothetical protein